MIFTPFSVSAPTPPNDNLPHLGTDTVGDCEGSRCESEDQLSLHGNDAEEGRSDHSLNVPTP